MQATLSLFRREFAAYFLSPIAYVVLTILLLVTGYLFTSVLFLLTASGPQGIEFPMRRMLGLTDFLSFGDSMLFLAFWSIFLVIPALLTMRLFAEEQSSGTIELLLTAPIKDWQIVAAKFLACFAFFVLLWLPTLVYLPVLLDLQWSPLASGIDPWPVFSTYLGLALAGGMFLALGMFISSLVKSQMVAALITLFISLAFVVPGVLLQEGDPGSIVNRVIFFFTVPLHFDRNFCRGLVDTRQIVLYISLTWFLLFLTVRSLESRRWR